jgi:hypothetical protein
MEIVWLPKPNKDMQKGGDGEEAVLILKGLCKHSSRQVR